VETAIAGFFNEKKMKGPKPHTQNPSSGEMKRATHPHPHSSLPSSLCKDGIVALTYATHPGKDDKFCKAVESAIQHEVPLRILGWGKKWKGLTQKLEGSLEALRLLPPSCTIVFTDAYDVLYSDGLAGIKSKFSSMGEPVLFSGECGCWPQIARDNGKGSICLDDYPTSPTPYRYLNSGQWIAPAGKALEIFEALIEEAKVYSKRYHVPISKINDQEMVSDMYIDGRFDIKLDHRNEIFQAMHATYKEPLEKCDPWPEMANVDGVWENKEYGTSPSIFHFNGGNMAHYREMEGKMWYKKKGRGMNVRELGEASLLIGDSMRPAKYKELCPG